MKASCSAPGKVILFGEHAVVYGVPAIAAATSDLRLRVDMELQDVHENIIVTFQDVKDDAGTSVVFSLTKENLSELVAEIESKGPFFVLKPTERELMPLREAFRSFNPHASQGLTATVFLLASIIPEILRRREGLSIVIASQGLPIGAGLGSSAAFSVALAGALLLLRHRLFGDILRSPMIPIGEDTNRPPAEMLHVINEWAFASEVVIHGTPSGLDNFTSCYGGVVKYDRSSSNFESMGAFRRSLRMMITNTKVPRSTKTLVAGVKSLHDSFKSVVGPVLESIGGITSTFIELIENDNSIDIISDQGLSDKDFFIKMGQLMIINHNLLGALGVSHASLQRVFDESTSLGFPSKLTGAGGGGCAITLLEVQSKVSEELSVRDFLLVTLRNEASTRLKNRLKSLGYDVFESALAGEGVIWHETK